MRASSWLLLVGVVGSGAAANLIACGSSDTGGLDFPVPKADGGGDEPFDPFQSNNKTLVSVSVSPATASIEILNDVVVTQQFAASASYSDGSTQALAADLKWSADPPSVGEVGSTGLYTPSTKLGGLVTITADYKGTKGKATLAVKLHYTQNPSNVPANTQTKLKAAATADAKVMWAYPYDKTVFPRGLGSTPMMWNNSAAGDAYYVHLKSPYYELEEFTTADPPSRVSLAGPDWDKFVGSTTGAADVFVNRWDGANATTLIHHTWTIAPASLRGTVYYWANNTGRIMRIKPGASAPDDFSNGVVPGGGNGCTMTCHAVSADGSTLVSAGGTYGGSYDLVANKTKFALGGGYDSAQSRQWALPAVSPDGKFVVVDALANQLGAPISTGMFSTLDGSPVANNGLPNERMYMPAFSPDGSSLVFVTGTNPNTNYWAATGAPGKLRVLDFNPKNNPMFSNERDLVLAGADPTKQLISWPSVAPDGKWSIYSRLNWTDPASNHNLTSFLPIDGDLYLADVKNGGNEVKLANLDGDGYPFAAGVRDLNKNFEPSIAPVAAGGYFWVVFHSRRTYGNVLTAGPDAVKQLWIAAIDQNPKPGVDPSHPAFRLPGQAIDTLNLRGYFALDPCKADGQSCTSGTDCCNGYCDPSPDGGAPVCGPKKGCANNGDKCDVSADCCGAASGTTCINHVCSEPTPN